MNHFTHVIEDACGIDLRRQGDWLTLRIMNESATETLFAIEGDADLLRCLFETLHHATSNLDAICSGPH